MKNSECTIYLSHGKRWVRKEKSGWIMLTSRGILHPITAEQLLSHILPALAFKRNDVVVVPDELLEFN